MGNLTNAYAKEIKDPKTKRKATARDNQSLLFFPSDPHYNFKIKPAMILLDLHVCSCPLEAGS